MVLCTAMEATEQVQVQQEWRLIGGKQGARARSQGRDQGQ